MVNSHRHAHVCHTSVDLEHFPPPTPRCGPHCSMAQTVKKTSLGVSPLVHFDIVRRRARPRSVVFPPRHRGTRTLTASRSAFWLSRSIYGPSHCSTRGELRAAAWIICVIPRCDGIKRQVTSLCCAAWKTVSYAQDETNRNT